jgi:hypothetical protein
MAANISFHILSTMIVKPSCIIPQNPAILFIKKSLFFGSSVLPNSNMTYHFVPAKDNQIKIISYDHDTRSANIFHKFDKSQLSKYQTKENFIRFDLGDYDMDIFTDIITTFHWQLGLLADFRLWEPVHSNNQPCKTLMILLGCGKFSFFRKPDGTADVNLVFQHVYIPVFQNLLQIASKSNDSGDFIRMLLRSINFYCHTAEERTAVQTLIDQSGIEMGIVNGDLATLTTSEEYRVVGAATNATLKCGNGSWGIQQPIMESSVGCQCSPFNDVGVKIVTRIEPPFKYFVFSHSCGSGNNGGAIRNTNSQDEWTQITQTVLRSTIFDFLLCMCYYSNLDHTKLHYLYDNFILRNY